MRLLSESPFAVSASLSCVSVQNVERKTSIPLPVLLLKEFDEHRGEHVGVNHVGLTRERVAAGAWQDVGQRISAMANPGVARATIYHQHRHCYRDPAIWWKRFALHDIADKCCVVGNGMCYAGHARPGCLILLHATDVFGRNAHGLRQKVFDRFVALPLGRERREMLRVVGGHGLAAVIDNETRLIHPDFGNARGDSGGIQAHYPARRETKDHGFAASVLDQCLQVFHLAFLGEGLFVGARATAAPVVVVDREVLTKQFGRCAILGSKTRYAIAPLTRMTAGPDPTLSKAMVVPS